MKRISFAFFASAAVASFGVPAFAAASGAEISPSDLGNVMYVGDSITHGVSSGSYRWALHKIFVDNGISSNNVGVISGNYGGTFAGSSYGGVAFENVHSSQASARAYEIAGRKSGGRFSGSNIENWLGLSGTTTTNETYTGETFDVDTFFLMIGTNDLLSDTNADLVTESGRDAKFTNLLGEDFATGDMGTIVDAMYKSNADASVTVLSIPCWTTHANSNTEDYHAAVAQYNADLQTWVSNYNAANGTDVKYVDINKGLIDVAATTSFFGVASMFKAPNSDGLHPNAQGDLIIAGNIAKALGYAGRTAGQERRAASEFSTHIDNFAGTLPENIKTENTNVTADGKLDFSNAGESTLVASWAADADLGNGYTVDFGFVFGNGAADGWDTTNNLSVTLGSSSSYGVLEINEAYISWGGGILYSDDLSANTDSLRIAYVTGNVAEGVSSGFYVWLGDMLIGEALSATSGSENNGVTFSYSGTGTVLLDSFSMDGSGSYAPTTTLYSNEENAFRMSDPNVLTSSAPQGVVAFPAASEFTKNASGLTASDTDTSAHKYYVARTQADSSDGGAGTVVGATISGGSATAVYANSGNFTGDVYATVEGGSASAWYAAHGASGDLNGNVGLSLTGDCAGAASVFGAVNAGTVSGNVYVDISAENATFNSFTNSTTTASVVGAYKASIAGTFHLQISAGTFNYRVLGGLHTEDNSGNFIGQTEIFINGGNFFGGIYGGGDTGTIGNAASAVALAATDDADAGTASAPASSVTVTAGTLSAGVYGGGLGGTIIGDAAVVVTGGVIVGGIYGGGSGGTIDGNTSVAIIGNTAQLRSAIGSAWSAICGGGSADDCKISGNASVVLKDVFSGDNVSGFDKYEGTISGGSETSVAGTRSLILDNVQLTEFGATLADFDSVELLNNTATALSSVGGAETLTLGEGTSLDLSNATDLETLRTIVLGDSAALTLDFSLTSKSETLVVVVDSADSDFSLLALNGAEDMDLSRVKFCVGEEFYDAVVTIPDAQAGTVFLALSIPEPSAFGLLAGTFALALAASRRRRSRK